ncbi:hypothetical protein EFO83_01870 [Lacticaseibacillus rhamnosus]|uniref:Uncharacterized protein n=1 Tax=Lacticaseibacillus rhamnosus TaxID=47715 RepID=A0AAX0K4V2_LACRH|nr:hypothetical protein LR24_04675 [Lacticaseibacillus rhamnosus]OFJ92158.1 hypothetical protein HMPREF2838_02115 [Lactobacillus sp. HMSC066G01]OFP93695.1 hypothetical protein HMPREF2965_08875 [Lactobacillus sp. HMSC075D02]MCT3190814.1 hypothetical protein [Lacticaseibacillus rhamnosus]MCT3373013.1 hypothetical protein [Lacticaseibacillus rhamnosus]
MIVSFTVRQVNDFYIQVHDGFLIELKLILLQMKKPHPIQDKVCLSAKYNAIQYNRYLPQKGHQIIPGIATPHRNQGEVLFE